MTVDELPLSFSQQRMWFLAQLQGVSQSYHIPYGLHLHGPLDVPAWQLSLNALLARHEALRSVFVSLEGHPHVELLPPECSMPFSYHDLREAPQAQEQLKRLCAEEASTPFDLSHGPLIRARLIRLKDQQHLFLLTQHHIVSDGWSMGILVRELSALYGAFSQGRPDPLAPLPIQYPDYALWQRQHLTGERLRLQAAFWREALAGAPSTLELPTDRPRPPQQSFEGARVPIQLDPQLTAALKRFSQQHGTTLFMTLLAAWAVVLARLSGQQDLLIGTPSANRTRRELEPLIGLFVNTQVLRIDLSGEPTVAQLLSRVRAHALAAQDHQDLPFEQVVEILQPPRHLDRTPLFQVMFAWQNNEVGTFELPELTVSPAHTPLDRVKFDLELTLREAQQGISGSLRFATALFDAPTIERHAGYLHSALHAMLADPQRPVAELPLLSDQERTLLLEQWNRTDSPYPKHLCIHQLFEQQVERSPEATALSFGQLSLSYQELNLQANRLAHHLIALGAHPDARIAICLERSPAMIIGLLAILKAGAAYVPLDPAYPSERLAQILTDAAPHILLTDTPGRSALGEAALLGLKVLDLDGSTYPWATLPATNPDPTTIGLTPSHLAYIIYTSGSTGSPKGVMVEHRNVAHVVANSTLPNMQAGATGYLSSPAFDATTWEVWATLIQGGKLVLIPHALLLDSAKLQALLHAHKVRIQHFTTGLFNHHHSALGEFFGTLDWLMFGGDQADAHAVAQVQHHSPSPRALLHCYGPTETTTFATTYELRETCGGASIPIGRPIANTYVYLLDTQGEPVPLGAVGEIYIGGAGVARGYLNLPELTAERFLPDPFSPHPAARMYKSGDLARYLPDGNLLFLGRNDQQVKIRGFRIEPGEIEAHLTSHPAVREAVVIAREDSPAEKRLVAYLTCSPEADLTKPLAPALRSYLTSRLPEYMVPSAFVHLRSLPLSPNGKLDRNALPAPEAEAFARQAYEPPQGQIEQTLATLWEELLGLSHIGRHDNFFELGGHSLLAVRLLSRLRLELPLASLFAHPTLCALAPVIAAARQHGTETLPPITPCDRQGELSLSFSQQRMWFLAQLQGVSQSYHIPYGLHLHGPLDVPAWQLSLNALLARHEALRSVFVSLEGHPHVELLPPECSMPFSYHDLREAPQAQEQLKRLCAEEASTPFDLSHGPLIRARLIRLKDQQHLFLLTQHHIVSDGWSMGILVRELSALYGAFSQGRPDPLAPLPIQYPDYALWQRQHLTGERLRLQAAFWREALAGAPSTLELPTDRPRPPQQSFEGARVPIQLDPQLTAALKRFSQQHGTTLFMTLLAAWAVVLARLSGQQDLLIGTPSANRTRRELEPLIGLFVNTQVLRIDLSGEPTVAQLLSRVRAHALAAQDHQDLPFEQVVEILQPPRHLDRTPLFQVMFAWQNNEVGTFELPELTVSPAHTPLDRVKFDLELTLREAQQGISGSLRFATALFDAPTIERHAGYLHSALHAMLADPQRPVAELPLLSDQERTLLLEQWNRTDSPYPKHLCIHQLFEQQVERSPEATALSFGQLSLSYQELNLQANRLAHHLIALGAHPDARIAICLERSPAMIIGLLAILKAGAAYVPLDPAYPSERLAQILTDAAPHILLTDTPGRSALGEAALLGLKVLDLDGSTYPWATLPATNPDPTTIGLTPSHLAYIIYTSGSTGSPKGVMVEHRSLVNYMTWCLETFYAKQQGGGSPLVHSIAFDGIVTTLFGPMSSGQALTLPADKEVKSLSAGKEDVETYALIKVTPSHLRVLNRTLKPGENGCTRALMVGGETLIPADLLYWQHYFPTVRLINHFGPTEVTVGCISYEIVDEVNPAVAIPIGRPIANTYVYLLDTQGEPVPLGAVGEIYIGGAGVARGYLNLPELTAERFLPDPFSPHPAARMYKSGDLARYLPDGNLLFLGRNDQQVKIRGFRIEPGEIEAHLTSHPAVREAVVIAREDSPAEKRLVAYLTCSPEADLTKPLAPALRSYLTSRLPEYMVPSAFVHLRSLPLSPNGKLDRNALPAPEAEAFARQAYEPPQGQIEQTLATLWEELLGLSHIGRHDNFFELGGHSLLAIRLMERLRRLDLSTDVRTVFAVPTLAELAATLGSYRHVPVPPNLIAPESAVLTPDLLPLIDLRQEDIDRIVQQVPGGIPNIQDLYALSPLQDGILFHHLLATKGDPYLRSSQLVFSDRVLLDRYLKAMQQVVDRHDILRTAFFWEQLSNPAQVVLRQAPLSITEVRLDPKEGPATEQLARRFDPHHHRINLTQAPLLRFIIAREPGSEHWLLVQLLHHLVSDHSTLEILSAEIRSILKGQPLSAPQPFRNLIAQARLGISPQEHQRFFCRMLADIDEPIAPFGLTEVYQDGSLITQARQILPQRLNTQLRAHARRLGVSLASLCHLAWGQLIARTTGRSSVVFGTVLFGRTHSAGATEQAMGLFINTLPLRLDIDKTGVKDSVLSTHTRLAELLRHEHASLALAQRCSGVAAPAPLFSALLNYRHHLPSSNAKESSSDDPLREVQSLGGKERTNYPLTLSVEDFGHALGLTAQVISPLSPERICSYMQQTLEQLSYALCEAPEMPVRQLQVIPPEERTLLLEQWNRTDSPYPKHLCIHQLFEQQVERSPEATALSFGQLSLSYQELNLQANRLAHHLIALGAHPDARIAICLERSPAMIIGLLAILKAGAAYVPLDPAYPSERLAQILTDAAPHILLTDTPGRSALGEAALLGLKVLDLDGSTYPWATLPATNPDPTTIGLTPSHLAYIIYTSGSTGSPKGVMVEHHSVVNLAQAQATLFDMHSHSRVMQFASSGFDASIFEIVMALTSGACLNLPIAAHRQECDLLNYLVRESISHATLPPALLANLDELDCPHSVQSLILAGEAPNSSLFRSVRSVRLFNAYGPTESTVCATTWIKPQTFDGAGIPIGRPIANTYVYLLDTQGEPVPLGAVGEIYIGGAGVARGYLNLPELTAERFLPDPFSPHPAARMYKSGDLARYLPDGNLLFLGRNDQQVKIRGFRIEPGEIEAHLTSHPAVREAVVIAREDSPAEKRLVAYLTCSPEADLTKPLAPALRSYLTSRLPEYMVPSAFVHLRSLPLSPNGKLDRNALPAPEAEAFARQAYEPPQGQIEQTLATLWEELLGLSHIGRHDNFFELGGHSLLAVRLLSRLRLELPLASLFAHPTLCALAPVIAAARQHGTETLPPITPCDRQGELSLSFSQQRMWFLAQLQGVSQSYHIPYGLHLHGPLDVPAWQLSLNALLARHEALRSVFVSLEGHPHVELLPPECSMPFSYHDLREAPQAQEQLKRLCAEEASTPFDLSHGPLIRARLIRLKDQQHLFLLTQHHIVSDGWSMGILVRELSALYGAFSQGRPDPLAPLPIQYPDYALWQRQHLTGERLRLQAAFWREALAGAPSTLELPTDRPRPPQQSFEGARVPIQLDPQLTAALKRFSQQHGTTLFMTLLAAWAVVLARLSGQQDLLIGTPSANRTRRELEPLIGLFVNTQVLRIDLSGEPTVAQLLSRVRAHALAAQDHQDLPFEQVVEILQPPRHLDRTPLFQVMFAWQNNEVGTFELPELTVSPAHTPLDRVKFDLELTLREAQQGISGSLRFATALFDAPTIERHAGYLHSALHAMLADPQRPVAELPLLSDQERTLLLEQWNRTDSPYPKHLCIHQLFEQQVERSPEATALSFGQLSLSYQELNLQANRLAHHLIALGAHPDARIAICLERSPAMIIGLLAILKAGAAYVPLDPAYPSERLAQILTDAAPHILLTDTPGRSALGEAALLGLKVLDLDGSTYPWATLPATNPDPTTIGLTPSHLAYIIYTSGSTGSPKGVAAEHHNMVNRIVAQARMAPLSIDDVCCHKTPIGFVDAVFEILGPLCSGCPLVLAATTEPLQLARIIQKERVTRLISVPSLARALLESKEAVECLQGLRSWTLSGEVLREELLHGLHATVPKCHILNLYGSSEVAADSIGCSPDIGCMLVPIGKPLQNTYVYLLDTQGEPVPLGAVGEIYIGGAGVARGYLNLPELTAERFLPDPFSPHPAARMYKSGDLARYLPDGNLLFLGRNDQQVKIRGFRIEPGEIEAHLTSHPAVREAVVIAREDSPAEKRLVAYLTCSPEADLTKPLAPALRSYLTSRLPEYMVPSAFVHLRSLPLSPNGKLDRNALPAPEAEAFARQAYEPPQGQIEQTLATLWEELLGLSHIGRHDNFFELGGHSLLAVQFTMQLLTRLPDSFNIELPLSTLFAYPSLKDLAAAIANAQRDTALISPPSLDRLSLPHMPTIPYIAE